MRYTKHSNCFGLSNLRKDGARSVMLRVTCKGQRTDLYTGVNLKESQWSTKTHRVKQGCKVNDTPFNVLNESLDAQEKFVNDYFNEMAMLEIVPSLTELKQRFNAAFKATAGGKKASVEFYYLFDQFIEKRAETKKWQKSMKEAFTRLRNILYDYKPDLSFASLSEETMNGIVEHLSKTMYNDSIVKRLSYLKQYVLWAQSKGYLINKEYLTYSRKFPKAKKEVHYLTVEELTKVWKHEFKPGSTIEQVRDCFVFSCHTGLRYSDIKQLTHDNILLRPDGGYQLNKLTEKDDDIVNYRLSKVASEIYLKYKDKKLKGGALLPVLSNQKYNDYLKEIGEAVALEGEWIDYEYRLDEKIQVKIPKRDLTSHVARRTFVVTVSNAGVGFDLISMVTSHSNQKSMKPYLKASTVGTDKVIDAMDLATAFEDVKETGETESE